MSSECPITIDPVPLPTCPTSPTTSTATVQSEEILAPLPTCPKSSTTSTATVQSEKILAPLSTSPTTSTQTTVQSEEILAHLPTSPSTPHAASSPAPRLKSPFKLKTVIKKRGRPKGTTNKCYADISNSQKRQASLKRRQTGFLLEVLKEHSLLSFVLKKQLQIDCTMITDTIDHHVNFDESEVINFFTASGWGKLCTLLK